LRVPVPPSESTTVTVAVVVPVADGVPEIRPPVVIERPAGRPVAENVNGVTPPVAVTWVPG
jgi:hypothetical protein